MTNPSVLDQVDQNTIDSIASISKLYLTNLTQEIITRGLILNWIGLIIMLIIIGLVITLLIKDDTGTCEPVVVISVFVASLIIAVVLTYNILKINYWPTLYVTYEITDIAKDITKKAISK